MLVRYLHPLTKRCVWLLSFFMRLCLISVQDVYLVPMVDCQIANFELTGTDYNTKEMLTLNMFKD